MALDNDAMQSLISRFGKNSHETTNPKAGASQAPSYVNPLYTSIKEMPSFRRLQMQMKVAKATGILQPFFTCHDALAKAKTKIEGLEYLNFSTYDYLGLNGDLRVNEAAIEAMQKYGTSASASRLVAGERPIHRQFEQALANHYGTQDALTFVSGYATNVSVISTLFDSQDVIFEDSLCHNSIVTGAKDSGAKRVVYPHNNMQALRELLVLHRGKFKRALIVTEGVFSMDGNYAKLKDLIALKKEFGAFLMVDEAHALGVAGKRGLGSFEEAGVNSQEVDIWMGTLSKTLCTCGGFIAGSFELIELLKFTASAFVYSVGLSPVLAAASLKALSLLHQEPWRVEKLKDNALFAIDKARELGLNTGLAQGTAIVPIMVGSSMQAAFLSNLLMENGVCALPIIYPVVPEGEARLRLFLSTSHSHEEIEQGLLMISKLMPQAFEKEQAFVQARGKES